MIVTAGIYFSEILIIVWIFCNNTTADIKNNDNWHVIFFTMVCLNTYSFKFQKMRHICKSGFYYGVSVSGLLT